MPDTIPGTFFSQVASHDLQFTGAFNTLTSRGFRYAKLFASNYITYEKHNVWIYRRGRSVVVGDTGDHGGAILRHLIACDFAFKPDDFGLFELAIDYRDGSVHSYDAPTHDNWTVYNHLPISERSKQPHHFRRVVLEKETVAMLRELYENNELRVVALTGDAN